MRRSRPPAAHAAFTLLEVMAAVLILGLLYAALATAAIEGLRSEGVSRRKVEASLVADRFLADLEAQMALGQIPPSGAEEQEVDVAGIAYRVAVQVQAFDPTPMLQAIEKIEKERGIEQPRASSRDEPSSMEVGAQTPSAPVEDLLAAPRTGEDGRLRRIDVSVVWQDGEREETVTRTTFAFDTTGLESLFPEEGAPGAASDGGEDAGAEDDRGAASRLDRRSGRSAEDRNRQDRGPSLNMPTLPVQRPPPGQTE